MFKKNFLVLLCFFCFGFTYDIIPDGLPKGLPSEIKGNFRIIERNAYKTHWIIYDVKKWEETSDGVKMYPPVYVYEYYNNKWIIDTSQEPIDNIYRQELVTIINPKKKTKQSPKEGKQLTASQSKRIIALNLKRQDIWTLKSFPYKGRVLTCGYNEVMPEAIAIWWSKGDKVYNVNGIARSNTGKFKLTFDIDISKALNECKRIKESKGSADNLPAVPLDSTQAYYKLLKASEPINIPHNSSIDVQARYLVDFFTRLYKKAGFSFEKTLIGYAEEYKKDPQFHTLRKYDNTAARIVWGHALYFSDLDDYPFHKYFSKGAYKALVTIEDTNKHLEGKK